jgi:hypothetical protein
MPTDVFSSGSDEHISSTPRALYVSPIPPLSMLLLLLLLLLWLYSPLLGLGPFFSFLIYTQSAGLFGRG